MEPKAITKVSVDDTDAKAADLIRELRGDGFSLALSAAGKLVVRPGESLGKERAERIVKLIAAVARRLRAEDEAVAGYLAGYVKAVEADLRGRQNASGSAAVPAQPSVFLVEAELVSLGSRVVAFPPGAWERAAAAIVAYNRQVAETWVKKQRRSSKS